VLAVLFLSAFWATGCGGASSEGPGAKSSTTQSTSAQDFSGRDIDGKTVRLSDYLGKQVVLLDFWSTYCEPCKAEMPHLRRMYDAYKAKGFVVMGIAMDGPETVAEVPAFSKRNGMTFPVVLDEDSTIASIYNPKKSAPLSVLIARDGKIVRVHEGYNPGDEEVLEKHLRELLDGAPANK
jgi:peroxiredoxin